MEETVLLQDSNFKPIAIGWTGFTKRMKISWDINRHRALSFLSTYSGVGQRLPGQLIIQVQT
jgi:hypothetical protein